MGKKGPFQKYFNKNGTTIEKMGRIEGFPFKVARMYQIDRDGITDMKIKKAVKLYKITSDMFGVGLNIWDILIKKYDKEK